MLSRVLFHSAHFAIIVSFLTCSLFAQETNNPIVRDSIRLMCDQIAADSMVETEYVGEAGMLSKQWQRYEKLLALSSDEDLVDLTDHPSPAVRLYSYYGLTRRNPEMLVEALRNHPDDTATVPTRNGCLIGQEMVVEAAIVWAHEFWVRGNPSGMSKADKMYLHDEYIAVMQRRRERSRAQRKQEK